MRRAPALAAGGYWYLRNLVHTGNPLPWLKGAIVLPAPDQPLGGREEHGVTDYIFDFGVWGDWFGPGLRGRLGLLWPLLAVAGLAAVALCLVRRAEPAMRLLGVVILATVAAWLVAPASAEGPEGSRWASSPGCATWRPALALALALLPLRARSAERAPAPALLGAYVVVLPFADASSEPWSSGYVAAAVLAGLAAASRWPPCCPRPACDPPRRRSRRSPSPSSALAAVVAGYRIQRSYLEDRYAEPSFTAPGLDAAFAWARDL